MSDPVIGISMLVMFIFIIMLGFPIAFTLMAMGGRSLLRLLPGLDSLRHRVFTLLVQKLEVASTDVPFRPVFTFRATHRPRQHPRSHVPDAASPSAPSLSLAVAT